MGIHTVHLLDVPMELRLAAQAAGASWSKTHKAYAFEGPELPPALQPFASQPYSLERRRERELRGQRTVAAKPTAAVGLRPHQSVAASEIAEAWAGGRRGFVLSDDVGLGKTYAIIAAILDIYEVDTVLVVCPIYAIAHWRASIAAMGDLGKCFVVINYDRLKKLMEVPADLGMLAKARRGRAKKRRVASLKGVVRFGIAQAFDIVVWDECQRLRNPDSARSGLAAKITEEASFAIFVSATTGQNPVELQYLWPLLDGGEARARTFGEWCQANGLGVTRSARGKLAWAGLQDTPEGVKARKNDLVFMRRRLFEGPERIGLRRTPEDLVGWPPLTRTLVPVELTPEAAEAYRLAWHVFREHLKMRGGRTAAARNALVEQLRFRQKASLLRIGSTCSLVEDLLDAGRQVAVSVAFHETLRAIRDHFVGSGVAVAEIHGALQPREKEANRMAFQTGRVSVVLYTPVDAISLHQGEHNDVVRDNVLHDVRWSGVEVRQLEGRTHRNGMHSVVHWLYAADTVEAQVVAVVAARIAAMATMHGDGDDVEAIYDAILDL